MSLATRVTSLSFFLVIVFNLMLTSVVLGQAADGSQAAQKLVVDRYAMLIKDYVLTGKMMDEAGVKAFEEEIVKSRDVRRYRQEFPEDVKLKLSMATALVDYYAGNGPAAVKSAYRVVTAAPNDKDMKNCCIYLAYMTKEYSYLKKLLGNDAGKAAIDAFKSGDSELASKVKAAVPSLGASAGSNDPNNMSPDDPNSAAARSRRNQATTSRGRAATTPPDPRDPRAGGMPDPRDPRAMVDPRDPRAMMDPRAAMAGGQADAAPTLEIDASKLPITMLGKTMDKMTLESINGGYQVYDPAQGKTLCLLLAGYNDAGIGSQIDALAEKFKNTGGSFGPVQYISVICNELANMAAVKFVFEDAVNHPALWSQCVMTPGNKLQLSEIEPASSVVVIVGKAGDICYVGPADSFLADSVIKREAGEASLSFNGEMPTAVPAINPEMLGAVIGEALNAAMAGATTTTTTTTTDASAIPAEDDIAEDPTVLQAKGKLDAARAKMKVPVGISFKSALDLCDEVLAGWPNTRVAEEAKEIIADICSRSAGQTFKEQRIKEGKYVGEPGQ